MLAERTVFADRAGISLQQLYAWNALLGESGEYCNTGFWGDTYYCVGVSGSTVVTTPKPSTSRSTETPGPTQTGIVSTFRTYLKTNDEEPAQHSCPELAYPWRSPTLGTVH
jgi:hypothetical protein